MNKHDEIKELIKRHFRGNEEEETLIYQYVNEARETEKELEEEKAKHKEFQENACKNTVHRFLLQDIEYLRGCIDTIVEFSIDDDKALERLRSGIKEIKDRISKVGK
jgi:hypothetical protein